ncbi:cell wall hydrolase [Sphingomonas sinipercae]|uniref:Cell wall hydrolase n=1 Tax=Sphingomonas sinipercae TaxID=2714944 RepID=A0A6G7ZKV2_9SPHN|nr:cell wall hydrolase [Sphingomonas sinipercae]
MSISLRWALIVAAALNASSVAPAQVGPKVEPLLAVNSVVVPTTVVPTPIEVVPADPATEVETTIPTPTPTVNPKADLATLVADLRSSDPGSRELECLAAGIYFESKSEPLAGQLAVGEVIANRASSGRFAKTYCGVLTQRGQFSFVRGGRWPAVAKSGRQWQTAVAIAKIVDQDLKDSAAGNALFFHAKRVSPGWRLKRVASIGNHVFYR